MMLVQETRGGCMIYEFGAVSDMNLAIRMKYTCVYMYKQFLPSND